MVAIIENKSKVQGKIISAIPSEKLAGYVELTLLLEKAVEVENFPNLAKIDEGKKIILMCPPAIYSEEKFSPGNTLHCIIKKVSPTQYFISPT